MAYSHISACDIARRMEVSTVQQIKLRDIDPDSTINVRRQGVGDNVEKVKVSIRQHGYWPDMPIVVRSHPDSSSEYVYENVTGQCRFKACLELGLEEIPAFVLNLTDDQAIQRSWLENEARGDLTYSDRAYWTERIYKRYSGEGYTAQEALEKAADYLGVTSQTVMRYYALVALPEDLKSMVDQGTLSNAHAVGIVRNTFDGARVEESQESMKERASWLLNLDRDAREQAVQSLQDLGHGASISDLNKDLLEKKERAGLSIEFAIPRELHDRLIDWGKERGLEGENAIVSHMVADVLRRSK